MKPRDIAENILNTHRTSKHLVGAIEKALIQARNKALEEAAKVAESVCCCTPNIAKVSIRSLKEPRGE